MKMYFLMIVFLVLGLILNIVSYNSFLCLLSIVWYIATVLILYLAFKSNVKYHFRQFNFKKMLIAIRSKSHNKITPLASLCISLASKIGVGSLSGIALAIYFGGTGSFFWLVIISLFVAINTYLECVLGIKYRIKVGNSYVGGPGYYISKCLNNKYLSKLYSFLTIISYGILFLSIQANTIVKVTSIFKINNNYIMIVLVIFMLLIILKGLAIIVKVNNKLVPTMLLFYLGLGLYVIINNYSLLPSIFLNVLKEAFKIKSIIPVFLIGMQRGIFITESTLGNSAIAASGCDNTGDNQGMLEVFGIYITIFLVCLVTFLIIVTSDYSNILFNNLNGIEIIMYAFNYHFGYIGSTYLSIITILFAVSTIISSYYFGESNIHIFSVKRIYYLIYKIVFILVIIISCYIKPALLWNLTDYFIAILAIINAYAIIKIDK